MSRVLVFGGTGFVGSALLPRLAGSHDAMAPGRDDADLTSPEAVGARVARTRPDVVVNLAAARDARDELRVNGEGAGHVARAARKGGARLVHVSSDAVLDGDAPPYTDEAPANPVHAYGRSKAAGEAAVRREHPEALIVRTSLVFDPAEMDRATRRFAARLAAGQACVLFTDEIRCPIARGTLCDALIELADLGLSGTLNVVGRQPLSRHDFVLRLLRWFDVPDQGSVRAARSVDQPERRPLDLRLETARARGLLRTELLGVDDELARAKRP